MDDSFQEGRSNLDAFFQMFDWVDEDISELNEVEENEVGGYECLFIAFNNLRSYCRQIRLDFHQIEEQYLESVDPEQSDEKFWDQDPDATFTELDELAGFGKLLETIEKGFSEYEKFCEKSDEVFDEWHCVLIMYSFLRKYCDKIGIDYGLLQKEITALQDQMDEE
ncbi:MAG: hypothetical protein F3743_00540 [Nitrospinae bacterium]|nr:hypothetical protein [Nitrospinota bacterium]MZH03871.1 hypothetical protein [Nitrospinota bacterium]MZH15311.1 hypothetical protein [Nitrospinota bacterium]